MQVNTSAVNVRALLHRPASPVAPTSPTAASAPVGRPAKIDHVANLQAAWGSNDSTYDLNTDGTVDGSDLGLLLSRLNKPVEEPANDEATALDQLLADWGKSDSKFDLNSDGSVDGGDLGLLLAGGAPVEPAQPAAAPTHLEALQADWGKSGSKFDLNSDGTVDGADLGLLLGGAELKEETSSPAADPQSGLLAAWGTADAASDLNKDGTVDGADLGLLLGNQGEPAETPTQASEGPGLANLPAKLADAILNSRDRDQDGQLTIRELGIGTSLFKTLDADGDGIVNASDLRESISRQLESALKNDPSLDPAKFERRWLSALNTTPEKSASASPERIADDLLNRLTTAGYRQTPPAGLRQFIEGLNLTGDQSSKVLARLGQHYPPGSRVSATA
jgi:hypothetical protein